MSVLVYSPIAAASGPIARTFSDNFNRADTAASWGPNWYFVYSALPNGTFIQSQNILGMVQINSNHARMKSLQTGGGGAALGMFMIPRSAIVASLFGKPQFAQATYVNGTGTVAEPVRSGPAVMITPDNNSSACSYEIISFFETGNLFIGRGTGLGRVNIGPVPLSGLNAGDVLRLEATPGPASTRLVTKVNGTVIDDRVDAAGPILTGVPGMNFDLATNASANLRADDWDDFSCGPI